MRFPGFAMALLAAVLAGACSPADLPEEAAAVAPLLDSEEARDEFTHANPLEARVTHVALDLALDFEGRRVEGTATLDIVTADDAAKLVLDSAGLMIGGITDGAGNALAWELGESDPVKGEALTVVFGETAPDRVVVTYASGPDAAALQWLDREQTAGGEYPFMFSQGNPILNRSWIPTQDSPGLRQSWNARITAPSPLTVVMSGIRGGGAQSVEGARRAFTFAMENSVPPYLIAIAAGDLSFASLGPRSGVWAEPAVLDAAQDELAGTEDMLDAAEELYGPYRWGRYDMVVLPPAFPYGGMENPVMAFLTPTFIAGDRSNTGLIAHELAHSWSGNLVTYASWRDAWLNEGVTSYIANRISQRVFGDRRAMQDRALSFANVEAALAEFGEEAPITALRTPNALDPLAAQSAIVYDKGALFLHTLEAIIGRERFDAWLRGWFDRHAFQPATSQMFLADLRANLVMDDEELEDRLMLDQWVYGTGLPDNAVRPDPQVFSGVDGAIMRYDTRRLVPGDEWGGWTNAERLRFLQGLPGELSDAELARLGDRLDLDETLNSEIRFLWLQAGLRNRYQPAVPQAEEFLSRVGRAKFVVPLFEELAGQGEWGMAIAQPLYERARPAYHSYTRGQVDALLGWGEEET